MKDNRIRVLHVLQTIGMGGMEKRILRLHDGLDPSLYDIHAVSLRPTQGAAIDWPRGSHRFYPIEPGLHPERLFGLAKLMRDGGFDIVHSHNWATMFYGVLAGRLAGTPIVLHGEHGLNDDDRKGVSLKRQMVSKLLAHSATCIVAVNEFIKRQSEERWRIASDKVVSIPNGVDLIRFSPRLQPKETDSELVFGTVARFDPIKNLPCIIHGFDLFMRRHPGRKARLVLVGDGPLRREMQALGASLPSAANIEFPGETRTPEDYYRRFDVYLNASFSEGMSNTILEGMACGLPVIASDVPGNRAWLNEQENAFFFASDKTDELTRCLELVAGDTGLLCRMGEENRSLAEREYDNRDFLQRYHHLYQSLLSK